MAIRHGLAGQFGKTEALERYRRVVGRFATIASFGFLVCGFAWGYFWSQVGPYPAIAAFILAAGVVLFAIRRAGAFADKVAKERVRFMRGGQGEALVAWLLEELDNEWHVFNGLKLEADSDIDHVVVGPGGVFSISTKSQRGLFSGTRDGLLHNGQPSPFAQQAMRQAMNLKDRLGVAMGRDVPWVQPILAVPLGYTEQDACGGKVWLVHQDNLIDRIAPEGAPTKLSAEQRSRTVKTLEMLESTAADVYRRP